MTDSQRQLLILFYNSQPTHTHTHRHTQSNQRENPLSHALGLLGGPGRRGRRTTVSIT